MGILMKKDIATIEIPLVSWYELINTKFRYEKLIQLILEKNFNVSLEDNVLFNNEYDMESLEFLSNIYRGNDGQNTIN